MRRNALYPLQSDCSLSLYENSNAMAEKLPTRPPAHVQGDAGAAHGMHA
jgi:hypothetical protein